MSLEVPFEHAFAMERAVRTYLAIQGVPTIPCNEFSGRNQQHQQAPTTYTFNEKTGRVERRVLPDLIRYPTFTALEIKTQGYAPYFMKAGVHTTGFKRRHFDHYRAYQQETGKPVEIAFVHLVENKIVGANLDLIEQFRTPRVNPAREHPDWYWEFDSLPVWPISLSDLLSDALKHGVVLGREGYSKADHESVLAYTAGFAKPNHEKHAADWSRPIVQRQEPLPF